MTQITIIGNLTDAPELRFTPQGKAVANFTVAVSKRVKDGQEWKDGPSTFWRVSLWDSAAENMADSLTKGQRVIVVGDVSQRSYETNAGESRTVFEVTATEVGPSLRWAICKPEKVANKPGGFKAPQKKAADDPWGSATTIGNDSDDAPF